jgi:hypothetical protein
VPHHAPPLAAHRPDPAARQRQRTTQGAGGAGVNAGAISRTFWPGFFQQRHQAQTLQHLHRPPPVLVALRGQQGVFAAAAGCRERRRYNKRRLLQVNNSQEGMSVASRVAHNCFAANIIHGRALLPSSPWYGRSGAYTLKRCTSGARRCRANGAGIPMPAHSIPKASRRTCTRCTCHDQRCAARVQPGRQAAATRTMPEHEGLCCSRTAHQHVDRTISRWHQTRFTDKWQAGQGFLVQRTDGSLAGGTAIKRWWL